MKFLRPLLIALLAALSIDTAVADPRERHRDDRSYEQRENYRGEDRHNYREYETHDNFSRRPIRDVIGEVEHNYRGRVVDVQPPRADEDMYRVRVLQEGGRVKTLHVPAERRRER